MGNMTKHSNKNINNHAVRLAIIVLSIIAGLVVFLANYIVTENDYVEVHIYDATPAPTATRLPIPTVNVQTEEPVPTKVPTKIPTNSPIKTKQPIVTSGPETTKMPITTSKPVVTIKPVPTPRPTIMPDISDSMNVSTQKNVKNQVEIKGKLVTTYENMSYYFSVKECDTAIVFYKEKGSDRWRLADTPVYSKSDKVYKGSICYLQEGKAYDVKIELFNNNKLIARDTQSIKTKNSNVKIAKTIKLSEYIKDNQLYGLYLKNIKGTPDGYIRIIGDINILSKGNGERYIIENGVS